MLAQMMYGLELFELLSKNVTLTEFLKLMQLGTFHQKFQN